MTLPVNPPTSNSGTNNRTLQLPARSMAKRRLALQVTVPAELIGWIDEQIRRRKFSTRSHPVEVALLELRRVTDVQVRQMAR